MVKRSRNQSASAADFGPTVLSQSSTKELSPRVLVQTHIGLGIEGEDGINSTNVRGVSGDAMQTPIASEKVQSARRQLRYHHGIQTIGAAGAIQGRNVEVGMAIQKVSGVGDVHKGTWRSVVFYYRVSC